MGISVFRRRDMTFERYLGQDDAPEGGEAFIARLVGRHNSTSMGGGVVEYLRVRVDWTLDFDEMITVIEGAMRIHSAGTTHDLQAGDVAWFPARTPLTYDVPERVLVSYAIHPMPQPAARSG